MKVFSTLSAKETQRIAKKFSYDLFHRLKKSQGACVVGLKGDLGSGKTTFMQGFARSLGIKEKILSPTFVIIKKYKIQNSKFQELYHIDCYRIENEEDIRKLGWDNIVSDPKNLVFVEWPERIQKVLPKDIMVVSFETTKENERKISLL